jgi:hypothetical protein
MVEFGERHPRGVVQPAADPAGGVPVERLVLRVTAEDDEPECVWEGEPLELGGCAQGVDGVAGE